MKIMKKIVFLISVLLAVFSMENSYGQWEFNDNCDFDNQFFKHCDTLKYEGIWHKGKPHKKYFDSAYSKPFAIVTDTIHPYPSNNHSTFEITILSKSGCVPIVGTSPLTLSFEHKYDTDSLNDGCYLEISYDGGNSWVNILNDSLIYKDSLAYFHNAIDFSNFYKNTDTIRGGIPAFTGKSKGWVYTSIEWKWCEGVKKLYPDSAIVRFNFKSNSKNTNHEGWMIDNIDVSRGVCGGINEMKNENGELRVYPNPARNYINIELGIRNEDLGIQKNKFVLTLRNIEGQEVKKLRIEN